jgi:uncharacterized membrane protein (DUF106 family)
MFHSISRLCDFPDYDFGALFKFAMCDVLPEFVIEMLEYGVIVFIVLFLISSCWQIMTDKKRVEAYNKRVAEYKKSIGK